MSTKQLFVKRVKELMAESELTAYKLSQKTGLSQGGLSKLFAGDSSPNLEMIEKIAKGLGVEVKDLFDFESDSSVPPHLLKLMEDQDKSFYDAVEMMAKAANPKRR